MRIGSLDFLKRNRSKNAGKRFAEIFHHEHQKIRDALVKLEQALQRQNHRRVRSLVRGLVKFLGPHFRYEEEALFPQLGETVSQTYIAHLLSEHDTVVAVIGRLMKLAGRDRWKKEESEEAVHLIHSIFPLACDCEGLSIWAERLSDKKIHEILEKKRHAEKEGLNLLEWAERVRPDCVERWLGGTRMAS